MLTQYEIDSLPKGEYSNSQLRKKFGPKHGTPVKFQNDEGRVFTLTSNRWWSRFRRRSPLRKFRARKENINTEFGQVYGKSKNINWLSKLLNGLNDWIKKTF